METIKRCLEQEFGLRVEDNIESLHATDNIILALVVSPHDGNKHKWLIRFSTVAAFDRWANSCAIEIEFETEEGAVVYLNKNKMWVYKKLLKYLSREYRELEEDV